MSGDVIADRSLIQYMQDDAYALLIQCFIRNSERSGYILKSEVYDATSDILVKDLVFIAINKENGLTIEVPFCCLYPYEGEVVDICLDRSAYRRDDSKNLPVGLHDDRFVWRLKRMEENSPVLRSLSTRSKLRKNMVKQQIQGYLFNKSTKYGERRCA